MTTILTHARVALCAALLAGCQPVTTESGARPGTETEQVAQAAYSIGDYQEAARLYERASAADPGSVSALLGLGRTYMAMGQTARAGNALNRASDLAPRNTEVRNELGHLALNRMHPREAIEEYDAVLAIDRRNLTALTGKAVALDFLSRHAEAQVVYRQALQTYPTNFALLSNYALSQVLSGDIGGGIALMEELLRDPAEGPAVRSNMAIAYALDGRTREARAMLEGTMSGEQITATLAQYNRARQDYLAGKPIGYLIFN
ncbi:tetratricopeptide repeat protein [Frigidibacter oleivorans]|uniref:tetratricopeptide repeat protein n=1 Tax=Frigidibacter oleivorans TaxID=2487129 RepID=UPI0013DF27B4|nr:tetratricopeptide repeat protein [Frigidibacter oleivorans]